MKLRIEIECDVSHELFVRKVLANFAEKCGWSFESLCEEPFERNMDYDNVHFTARVE